MLQISEFLRLTYQIENGMVKIMQIPHKPDELSLEDEAFFDRFYREHKQLLYYFAGKYAAPDAAEDLVHDVLERLMKQCQTIRKIANEPGKLVYYLNAATQSAAVDRFRRDSGASVVAYPPDALDAIIEDRLETQRLPFEDTYWDIRLLKKKLPSREWMLLEGKYLIGYSDEELGHLFGYKKNSIRMALTRAKRKAREILFANNTEGGASDDRR